MSETPPNPPRQTFLASTETWRRRFLISLTFLIWLALFLICINLLSQVQVACWVLVIAGLVAYALVPLVALFHRVMPRPLAILLVYLLAVGIVLFLLYLLVRTSIAEITSLARSIRSYLTPGPHGHASPLEQILRRLGISQAQLNTLGRNLESQLGGIAAGLATNFISIISNIFYLLALILFTIVVSIYLLADGEKLINYLLRIAPQSIRPGAGRFLQILRRVAGGYIRGEIIICIIIGALVGLGMFVLGVPYPAFLGALAALLEFIPVIGVLISGAICCLLALTQGWLLALIVLGYFIGIHVIEGYVLVPRIMGRTIGVHPAITLLAVIAGSELLGLIGAVLAGPFAGLIQSILRSFWVYYQETHRAQFPDLPQRQEER
jgi:predicted PurR-regulated permease PerM